MNMETDQKLQINSLLTATHLNTEYRTAEEEPEAAVPRSQPAAGIVGTSDLWKKIQTEKEGLTLQKNIFRTPLYYLPI